MMLLILFPGDPRTYSLFAPPWKRDGTKADHQAEVHIT